ncbi:MAG TPA: plasmid mobilization relaxosome protein MobC [Thermoanaerobaculia bacterium]|jgi:hypothetical protein|nr:plasmid mobilization relaxosome protein MobC [Thermoanaerobaculia bacterium]
MAGRHRNRKERGARSCIQVYATREERLAIRAKAEAAEVTESRYMLTVALARRLVQPRSQVDLETLLELSRIGNNLNQLTHLAHANRLPARLKDPLAELKALLDALRHELAVGA